MYFKPQKGKAYENLPNKCLATFDQSEWIVSTKYDGNQIFIVKLNNKVRMFTSDWKEFYIKLVAEEVHQIPGNFIIIGEFMHNCQGRLGDRVKSAVLTTYRTNFSKNLGNPPILEMNSNIRVFDILYYLPSNSDLLTNIPYEKRLKQVGYACATSKMLRPVQYAKMTGREAKIFAKNLVNDGWEGVMCVNANSYYVRGKRVNNSVKLKFRKTADLLCIGFEDGEGKYEGMIGALILKDSKNRIVNVGSGLDDYQRTNSQKVNYLGKVIEIEYEQIIDTYIQPTFICVRDEKTHEEID